MKRTLTPRPAAVALSAVILVSSALAGLCAQQPPAATAPAVALDPSLVMYQKLAQKVRSELQRKPDLSVDISKALSLEDCMKIALGNSGKILIAREKMLAAKMRYTEARRNLLPSLKWIGHLREGNLTSKTFKGEDYKVESSFDIIDGQKKFQTLEQAKQNFILAKKTYEKLRNDVLYQTRQTYYQISRNNTHYEEQKALFLKAQALAAKAKGMLEKKLLRDIDYLSLVSSYQEINAQILQAGEELTLSRMALCQLLHAYPQAPIRIQPIPPFKVLKQVKLEQCLTLAFHYRPDIALALITNDLYKLGVDLAISSTGLNVSATGHFGHKGEAFNEAKEGIQDRPDLKLSLKTTMPLEKHTIRYEPDMVKEVPSVGSTTSTLYNSHTVFFEFFNNTRERQVLEAKISYHDNLEDLETLKKGIVSDVARQCMDLERAAIAIETAELTYQLAQERSKVALSGAGETAVGPDDELRAALGISIAKRRVIDARLGYLSAVSDLNKAIGLDNYYDPFRGVVNAPADEPVRRIKKVWEFWKDDALEQDNALLPTKFYDEYWEGATPLKK